MSALSQWEKSGSSNFLREQVDCWEDQVWPHKKRDQSRVMDFETGKSDSYRLTMLEYCFELISLKEMTLELDLNNSWFGIYFQRGDRFEL